MKEGFLIGGGLIFVGLMLELSVGPVVWEAFAWPVNGIVLAGFLAIIALFFILGNCKSSAQPEGTLEFVNCKSSARPEGMLDTSRNCKSLNRKSLNRKSLNRKSLDRKWNYAFQFIGTYQAAIPAMVYAVVLTIIMGLTRQQVGGTWLNNMLSFWPFVLIYVYITVILGMVTLRRIYSLTSHLSPLTTHL